MTAPRRPSPRTARPLRLSRLRGALCAVLAAGLLSTSCGVLPARTDSGAVVTVMTWAPQDTKATNMPGVVALAQAYARWVNAEGGLGGRELRVLTCNEGNDSVGVARCARRARQEKAVAVVGSYSQHARSFLPQLESAGIPYLGGYGVSEAEFGSPLSYPVNGGQAALLAGSGRQLAKQCERNSLLRSDTTAGDELPPVFNAGLVGAEREPATDIRAREDVSEYTSEAEQALAAVGAKRSGTALASLQDPPGGGPGACVTVVLGSRTSNFLDSFSRVQKEHTEVQLASVIGSIRQSLVDRTGGRHSPLEGAYVTSWFPAGSDPAWDRLKEVVNEHAFGDNRIDTYDPGVQTTWVAYTVLRHVVESIEGPVTQREVRQRLDEGEPIHTGGVTPPLGWRYEDLLGTRSHPRLINSMVSFQRVREGRLVAVDEEPVDIAPTLESAMRDRDH